MAMNDQLNRYLNRDGLYAHEIERRFPCIWNVVGEVIERTNSLMHRVKEEEEQINTAILLGLWGQTRRYQINSILNMFSRNLDEGLAILRMATELCRTLKAISKNRENYNIWVKGRDKNSPSFKADAKFDPNDSTERAIFDAYRFCSEHGTHGHKTSAIYLEDSEIGKEPSLEKVSEISKMWFVSCIPMHRLSLRCIVNPASKPFFEYDLELTVLEAKLLERVQKDPLFTTTI